MRRGTEPIAPETVIKTLAHGIAAGIVVIVIYSAQALFTQPATSALPQLNAAPRLPAATTEAAASPTTQPGKTALSDKASPDTTPTADRNVSEAAEAGRAPTGEATTGGAPGPDAPAKLMRLGKAFAMLSTGLLVGGAALLSGAFLGFLFGIPRSLQQQGVPEVSSPESAAMAQGVSGRAAYGANTSLEQISDWLTKILVGVGLTQLSSLPSALKQFSDFAGLGLGGFETSGMFAVALLIYFLTCGFLMSYLWTRLRLGQAFSEADALAAIRGEIETAVTSELQKKAQGQMTIDYEALRLTEKQLESGDVPQEELDKAFRGTSDLYRSHIYQRASFTRSNNWSDPKKKAIMERTIPIFRALIATDEKKVRYHQNYAQLGFALAEKLTPDYVNAIEALNKAIELRGPAETEGYLWDEFVRAKCLADPTSTDPETKERVLHDLRIAVKTWPELADVIDQNERISVWMKANHVSLKSLLPPAS